MKAPSKPLVRRSTTLPTSNARQELIDKVIKLVNRSRRGPDRAKTLSLEVFDWGSEEETDNHQMTIEGARIYQRVASPEVSEKASLSPILRVHPMPVRKWDCVVCGSCDVTSCHPKCSYSGKSGSMQFPTSAALPANPRPSFSRVLRQLILVASPKSPKG